MNISGIQPGPIRHPHLSEDQLARIKKIHQIFLEVNNTPLDKTIENFQRDVDPEEEIIVWETMADAYQKYTSKYQLSPDKKRVVYEVLLLRSTMPAEYVPLQLSSNPNSADILLDEEINEVLSLYQIAEVPLTVSKEPGNETFLLN